MIHLGNISNINGADIEPVDAVSFGSPCQDISTAGLRAGMKHTDNGDDTTTRSGLFFDAIRVIKEMRKTSERRSIRGSDEPILPRWGIYENVPGAFSSNQGKDFSAVLTELVRIAEPKAPPVPVPENGWPHSGYLYDEVGRWSVAWTLHDAQAWGVAQRRKRIVVLADFDGLSAGEVVFDPQYEWKPTAENGDEAFGHSGGRCRPEVQIERESLSRDFSTVAEERETAPGCAAESLGGANSYTRRMRGGVDRDANGRSAGKGALIQTELSGTISASQDQTLFCLEGNGGRASHHGEGYTEEGVSYTLNTVEQHSVAVCLDMAHANDVIRECGDKAPTLQSRMGTGGNQVPLVSTCAMQAIGLYKPSDVGSACKARDHKDATDLIKEPNSVVRRLTPLECTRLQGFPDDWLSLPHKDSMSGIEKAWWEEVRKTAAEVEGKSYKPLKDTAAACKWYNRMVDADSNKYKALGNSIAVGYANNQRGFWMQMCKRISAQYDRRATLGSLFDGIGGFPLAWETYNGAGSARWASEVAEYPIAVTQYHFGGEL